MTKFLTSLVLASFLFVVTLHGQGSAVFQTRQTWTFPQDGVSFTNDFSGARLNGVTRTAANIYQLSITPETTPINDSPWYAFRVWATSARTVTLTLSYTGGHHRYSPKVSTNGNTWSTINSNNVTISPDESEASFPMTASATVRTVAGQPLITVGQQMAWAANLAQLPFVQSSTIGQSVQGRPLPRLDVTTAPAADSQTLILMTGQHPPEFTGVQAFRLFVETLLADTTLARQFRRRFNIAIYPLMNPDGWHHGHWRCNANELDTNRTWIGSGNPAAPEIQHAISSLLTIPNPAAFIDFHSTGTNIFYTGTDDAENPSFLVPEFLDALATRVPDWLWSRSANDSGDGSSSRSWVANELGCASLTWEWSDTASSERLAQGPVQGAAAMMELLLKLWGNKSAPTARYDFENSGSPGLDSAGTRHATVNGSPAASTPAAVGANGISLSPSNSFLSVADFDYGSAGTTLSFWFRMDANSLGPSDFTYLFSHGSSLSANNLNVYHRKTNQTLRVRVRDANDSVSDIDIPESRFFGDGNWHHLGVSIVPGTGTSVYLDGVLEGTTGNGNNGINPNDIIRIGIIYDLSSGNRYRGRLDDLRIYNTALSGYQLTALRHRDAPAEPYLDWKDQAFSSLPYGAVNALAADLADADGDGLETLLENALGGNPLSADAQLVQPTLYRDSLTGTWVFQHRRRTNGSVAYNVRTSTNLAFWTGAVQAFTAPEPLGPDFESATFQATGPAVPQRYFRLEATRQGN